MRNHIKFALLLVWYFCFYIHLGFSNPVASSLLLSSTTANPTIKETTNDAEDKVHEPFLSLPKIYAMHVETNVSNRFAKTRVTSKVKNTAAKAEEFLFSLVIPERAYISQFLMEIDGKSYEAYVQEKELAKNAYNQALKDGQTAAHVALNARDSNRFTVSVNLEPKSDATLYLTYEDLLNRINGKYEIILNIHPGQPIEELDVKVNINESRPLKFVKAPSLRNGNEMTKNDQNLDPKAQIEIKKSFASVKFSPTIEYQRVLAKNLGTPEGKGFAGQFIVQYDVERDPFGGEVLVNDGYFVHFFAPSELSPLPKNLVFVLDTSGSMQDIKIQQLKDAMTSILNEINENDTLNIIEFGTNVKVWNIDEVKVQYSYGFDIWDPRAESDVLNNMRSLPLATLANEIGIKNAKKVIDLLDPYGGTDILSALQIALKLVAVNKEKGNDRQPMIIFLTDGSPTVAELDTNKIIANITALNLIKAPIFSLSFGDNADKEFLDMLSIKNFGFARLIYEGADASLQLQEFYRQISSPLLTNVTFKYATNVTKVTETEFPMLFQGSELVVAGFGIDPDIDTTGIDVSGLGVHGPIVLEPEIRKPADNLERLWAYLTLKQILEQRKISENKTGPTQEALRLSKKYQFVTEVSSLVVLKPNNSALADLEDASKMFEDFEFQPTAISESGYPLLLIDSAPETDSFNSVAQINDLKSKLTWINDILNDNGTISLSSGVYELGSSVDLVKKTSCIDPVNNRTGFCATLYNCPEMYSKLTSIDSFNKCFCKMRVKRKNIAGICCTSIKK